MRLCSCGMFAVKGGRPLESRAECRRVGKIVTGLAPRGHGAPAILPTRISRATRAFAHPTSMRDSAGKPCPLAAHRGPTRELLARGEQAVQRGDQPLEFDRLGIE